MLAITTAALDQLFIEAHMKSIQELMLTGKDSESPHHRERMHNWKDFFPVNVIAA